MKMGLKQIFGIGTKRILAEGQHTEGVITDVKACWWMTINQKPVRMSNAESLHPQMVTFTYTVDGRLLTGKVCIRWDSPIPAVGSHVTVVYRTEKPEDYAVAW